MVYWLASVSGGGCKFTLKSFVLTAFNQALRRVRAGKLTIARPPALITVSKSGFEPLGWSLRPTQKGLTWLKVNLCHTCVTIWIMEFCNLSEERCQTHRRNAHARLNFTVFMLSRHIKSEHHTEHHLHVKVSACSTTYNLGKQNIWSGWGSSEKYWAASPRRKVLDAVLAYQIHLLHVLQYIFGCLYISLKQCIFHPYSIKSQ